MPVLSIYPLIQYISFRPEAVFKDFKWKLILISFISLYSSLNRLFVKNQDNRDKSIYHV